MQASELLQVVEDSEIREIRSLGQRVPTALRLGDSQLPARPSWQLGLRPQHHA
jgi:hypothetical protein